MWGKGTIPNGVSAVHDSGNADHCTFFGNSVLVFILWYMTRACITEWILGWTVQPLGHADPLFKYI